MSNRNQGDGAGRGFAIVEAAVVLVVGAILLVMLLVLGGESRRNARLGEDLAKLRQIGAWTGSYGADHSDKFWSFSWKKGAMLSQYPDLNAQAQNSDNDAAAAQAVDILRRVAGREDILPITFWIPHLFYSHLPLEDYLKSNLPDLAFVSSADRNRLAWARDPFGFDACQYQPSPPAPNGCGSNTGKRWPYGSSFQLPTLFYDRSAPGDRIASGGWHNIYTVPSSASLGARIIGDVAFPAHKVHMHDGVAWHFGPRGSHFAFPEMRLPLLFADGSVRVHASADANPGWSPNSPSLGPTQYQYNPGAWEPPTLSGAASQPVPAGRYHWTRGTATEHGIAGRDFGGPETCSGPGQPGCP